MFLRNVPLEAEHLNSFSLTEIPSMLIPLNAIVNRFKTFTFKMYVRLYEVL